MNIPADLLYTKSHEWVEFTGETTAKVGLTDFAQDALGDIVFINLPEVGDAAEKSTYIADVESFKSVSDIFSPFTGEIAAVNEELADAPDTINSDPYGAWIFEVCSITDKEELLSPAQYEEVCKQGI